MEKIPYKTSFSNLPPPFWNSLISPKEREEERNGGISGCGGATKRTRGEAGDRH